MKYWRTLSPLVSASSPITSLEEETAVLAKVIKDANIASQ